MIRIDCNAAPTVNMVLTGVGGQGVLTLADMMARAAMFDGHNVRVGEIHGMAQRGGHVTCTVRIGPCATGPIVDPGTAQLILGFEPIETLREIQFVVPEGLVILNSHIQMPVAVSMGQIDYPKHELVLALIRKFTSKVLEFDALDVAKTAGGAGSLNMVLFGAAIASEITPISRSTALRSIHESFPGKFEEVNARAFTIGYSIAKDKLSY
ncbi:MAG: indolepyruvate ferredoxin oxidoreductase subunit beta [Candidatus Thorarchaeota archaeon]|nr:MAG: indolepyruvate ferredoxin oxidoreductase subunit beta [Candidatus Thorarchaeota archaeon]